MPQHVSRWSERKAAMAVILRAANHHAKRTGKPPFFPPMVNKPVISRVRGYVI